MHEGHHDILRDDHGHADHLSGAHEHHHEEKKSTNTAQIISVAVVVILVAVFLFWRFA
jgi:hypothetical protein